MKSKTVKMFLGLLLLIAFPLVVHGAKKSDEMKNTLFSEVKTAMENAKLQKADLLSPKNYEEGYKAYMQASKDFDSDGNLETIKNNINTSTTYIQKAMKNIELSSVTLKDLLIARDAALTAQAPHYALKDFNKAEDLFKEAASYVEDGDVSKARKISQKAESQYKRAEELAFKEGLLGDIRNLRKKAEKEDIEDYCHELIKNADEAFRKAEKLADSGKYDEAKVNVDKAKYQYEHAIALFPEIKNAKKGKKSLEGIYRDFESRLATVASRLGLSENFDKGIDYQLRSITTTIDGIKKDREDLTAELSNTISTEETRRSQLNSQIIEKEKEIAKLKGKTTADAEKAALEAERSALLSQKLEKENMEKEKQNKIRKIFDSKEGLVLKDGSDIVLQLQGLTFPSGKSIIEVENFDLLAKVQKAIREYPDAKIVIEGHTDSIGDANFNQILSEERAEAVKKYLTANKTATEDKVTALGFGDSKPVAPNKTKDGRAKNRRIDVIIKTGK